MLETIADNRKNLKISMGGFFMLVYALITFLGDYDLLISAFNNVAFAAVGGASRNYFSTFIALYLIQMMGEIVVLVSTLSLAVFGVLLMCRIYNKGLAALPILQIVASVTGCFLNLTSAYLLGLYKYMGENFFEYLFEDITKTFPILIQVTVAILPTLILELAEWLISGGVGVLCWGLMLVAILVNCRKGRTLDSKGRMRFSKWVVSFAFLAIALLSVIISAIVFILSFEQVAFYTTFSNTLVRLIAQAHFGMRPFSHDAVSAVLFAADNLIYLAEQLVFFFGLFFSMSWIINPVLIKTWLIPPHGEEETVEETENA